MPEIRPIVDRKRALKQHAKATLPRSEDKHAECGATSTPNVSGRAGTTIGPLDVPPHVTVTPGERLWEVSCNARLGGCGAWHAIYSVTVASQPNVLQQLCDEHAACCAPVAA